MEFLFQIMENMKLCHWECIRQDLRSSVGLNQSLIAQIRSEMYCIITNPFWGKKKKSVMTFIYSSYKSTIKVSAKLKGALYLKINNKI